jgi:hypothetical protein
MQQMPEIPQTVIRQARLAYLAIGDLAFQESFQFGQSTIELVADAHQGAGLLNARYRFVENVDPGHVLKNAAAPLCSAAATGCNGAERLSRRDVVIRSTEEIHS